MRYSKKRKFKRSKRGKGKGKRIGTYKMQRGGGRL